MVDDHIRTGIRGARVVPTGIVVEDFAESLAHNYGRRMWHALCHYKQDDAQAHLAFPPFYSTV